jgi:hypothetical protein
VQRRDHGDIERAEEVEDILAIVAAPDRVVMLDRDDIDARPEGASGLGVIGALVASDPVVDLERERRTALGWEQDGDLAVTCRGRQIARVRRDTTAAGGIGGNESGPWDDVRPLDRSASLRTPWTGTGALLGRSGRGQLPVSAVGRLRPRSVDGGVERLARMDEPLDPL